MPAPPEIAITLDDIAFAKALPELGIRELVTVRFRAAKDDRLWGQQRGHEVHIFYGNSFQTSNRLIFVANNITRTLLHELRHVWQEENWTPKQWADDDRHAYGIKPSEIDANDFADRNLSKYRGLVRVKREQQSTLGRLSKAERNVRQRV